MSECKVLGIWLALTTGLATASALILLPGVRASVNLGLLMMLFVLVFTAAGISFFVLMTEIYESRGLFKGLFIRKRLEWLMKEMATQLQEYSMSCSVRIHKPQKLRYFYTLCNIDATAEAPEQLLKRAALVIDLKLDTPCPCGECGDRYKLSGVIRKEVQPHIRDLIQERIGRFCQERNLEPALQIM